MAKASESGMVYVNCYDVGDMTFEFSGYKQSGNTKIRALSQCLDTHKANRFGITSGKYL